MALTPSTMLALNTQAPLFSLIEPKTKNIVSLSDYSHQPVVIAFISNHCPYVIRLKNALADFAKEYKNKGVIFIAINANDVDEYPDDSPEKMIIDSDEFDYTFPYLFDETQNTAIDYMSACTPDFYLFDTAHKLYYRGQFDNTRPGSNDKVTGIDLRNATNRLLQGLTPPDIQTPSIGCSIKWKVGKNPH